MVDSSKTSSAYDTLIGVRDKLTRLHGIITPESVDKLEDELGGVCTIIKTHHYEQGQKYGHLASVIPRDKYRIVISDAAWDHTAPADPGAYSTAALAVGNAAAQREQLVAEHKQLQTSYASYLGVEEAGKELILYAVGDDALAPLKKQYIGFGDSTILTMLDHLRQKTAIKMTTAQKHEYKTNGYNTSWDPTTSITAYFTNLDRFQISLSDRGITTSDAEKTMAAGAQMWQSEMFTEDQMLAWENRPAADATILHRKMARTKAVLRDDRETITVQGSGPPRAGNRRGGGGRRNSSPPIHDAPRTARETISHNGRGK